jgi:class 3 adenylate cyclase
MQISLQYYYSKEGFKIVLGQALNNLIHIWIRRIKDIKDGDEQSRKELKELSLKNYGDPNSDKIKFPFTFFLESENNFREIFREFISISEKFDRKEIWNVFLEQSKFIRRTAFEFFEAVLQNALKKSDTLLNNILPIEISEELKENGKVLPIRIESATVLFTDFKGFTEFAGRMKPEEVVQELDECFSLFDTACEKHGLEKIKTIGDAFMCAGGVPSPDNFHFKNVALAAIEMRDSIQTRLKWKKENGQNYWNIRIGIHTGPLVAGVIGKKKFSYDIWSDTVNIASRMESSGVEGKINISQTTAELLKDEFIIEPRGKIIAKGKGELEMFFLIGEKKKP